MLGDPAMTNLSLAEITALAPPPTIIAVTTRTPKALGHNLLVMKPPYAWSRQPMHGAGLPRVVSSNRLNLVPKLTRRDRIKEGLQQRMRGKIGFSNDEIVPCLLDGNEVQSIIVCGETHARAHVCLTLRNQACHM